jgi:hypothetical protein
LPRCEIVKMRPKLLHQRQKQQLMLKKMQE